MESDSPKQSFQKLNRSLPKSASKFQASFVDSVDHSPMKQLHLTSSFNLNTVEEDAEEQAAVASIQTTSPSNSKKPLSLLSRIFKTGSSSKFWPVKSAHQQDATEEPSFDYSSIRHKAIAHEQSSSRSSPVQKSVLTNHIVGRLSPRVAPFAYQTKMQQHAATVDPEATASRQDRKGSSNSAKRRLELPETKYAHNSSHSQGFEYESTLRKSSEANIKVSKFHEVQIEKQSPLPLPLALSSKLPPKLYAKPSSQQSLAEKYLNTHRFSQSFLSKYLIGDILGEGGFGFVISALPVQNVDQQVKEVAVKFILKDKIPIGAYIADHDLGTSVPFELFILRRISHKNIIQLLEWFEDPVFYYLVTEMHGSEWQYGQEKVFKRTIDRSSGYMSDSTSSVSNRSEKRNSMDLFECIDVHKRFEERLAKKVFGQVVSAIYYLHHNVGVVHRDIKDENLVIDQHYNVKLIDFGAAAFIPSAQGGRMFTTFHGTPQYCAPEIIKGERYRGPEAEMWGLGVLLYTMLFGENPFNDPKNALDARMDVKGLAVGCGASVYIDSVCLNDVRHNRKSSTTRLSQQSFPESPTKQENCSSQELSAFNKIKLEVRDPNAIFLTSQCVDVMDGLLRRDPYKRLSIEQVKAHNWFTDYMEE